jgi:hypothetical protein
MTVLEAIGLKAQMLAGLFVLSMVETPLKAASARYTLQVIQLLTQILEPLEKAPALDAACL